MSEERRVYKIWAKVIIVPPELTRNGNRDSCHIKSGCGAVVEDNIIRRSLRDALWMYCCLGCCEEEGEKHFQRSNNVRVSQYAQRENKYHFAKMISK